MQQMMTRRTAVVTFEKQLAPGISVHVTGMPAAIVTCPGKDDLTLFDKQTGFRLERLLAVARNRMANGETDIYVDFADDV
jgi:hypothetical protein